MRKVRPAILLVFWFLAGCSLAGDFTPPPSLATSQAAQPLPQPTTPPIPTPAMATEAVSIMSPSPERGAPIYLENCAPCHGANGLGDGSKASDLPIPASPIGDLEFVRSERPIDWYDLVTEGRIDRYMPGFESLSDAERWDVLAYALTLSPQSKDVLFGEEIFVGRCVDCHGPDGAGTDTAPDLARFEWIAQHSLNEIMTIIEEGIQPGMPSFGDTLLEEERLALAQFIYDLSFPGIDLHSTEIGTSLDDDAILLADIRGQISNGTNGGVVPGGIEVTLFGFDGQQSTFTTTTLSDDDGAYQFLGVEIQPGRVFITTVEYQGATYSSEVAHVTDEFELDLPITVFESTSEITNVQVDRLHLILDMPVEGILQVTELWILSNLGDRTVATESGEGIFSMQLPENAANLGFESGTSSSRFQETSDGLIDRLPIRPGVGSHEIVFSFNLSLEESLVFSQPMAYPVEAIVMLSPQGVVELEGDGIDDLGLRQMSGVALHNYNAGPISAGEILEVLVKRERPAGEVSEDSKRIIEIAVGAGVFLAALAGTGLWLYRRKQENEAGLESIYLAAGLEEDILDEVDNRERILQAIADLDDSYAAGEIEDELYQERRVSLKNRLMEIP